MAQILCDFLFQLCLRHHRVERWLAIRTLPWPNPMMPVHFFNCSLVPNAIREAQASVLVCIRAKGGVLLRRRKLRTLLRYIDRRAESDKCARKKQREAGVTQWILAVSVSQFGARGSIEIAVKSPCNKDRAGL